MRSAISLAVLSFLVSACVSTKDETATRSRGNAEPSNNTFRLPTVMRDTNIVSVIGQPASRLGERLGKPRINLSESDAQKLQFVSDSCVLDIYLYPLRAGAAPVATHVEVRDRQNGNPVKPAICIAAIESAAKQ